MAFTTIRVRQDDKRAFEGLRHEFALRTGQELPQHELFHRILEQVLASNLDLMAGRGGPRRRSWTPCQFDLDGATDAAGDVDRVVYGLDQ